MTVSRRRKDPFAGKENVRHFRLVHRPLGAEVSTDDTNLKFEDLFEEFSPSGRGKEVIPLNEEPVDEESYDFDNDQDGEEELVDIDAELDEFTERYIDIEGDDEYLERVKPTLEAERVGEAAKFGILYDDRGYDYTKHLRRVGITPGAVFIQAPGQKKQQEKTAAIGEFFSTEALPSEQPQDESLEEEDQEENVKASHELARQQYKSLLQQVGDDPMLREVIEALEDERYVSGEFDDELVISLDNMNLSDEFAQVQEDDDDDEEEEDIDILNENEEFPDFIPSEALKRQLERIQAHEAKYEAGQDELDDILDEYDDNYEDEEVYSSNGSSFIDIEDESETGEAQEGPVVDEAEAAAIYEYLRASGRARGTTLYDKKRASHLPPIHIAIAQYNELRREMVVDNDLIIQKYSQEDEAETERQLRESEQIIEGLVKFVAEERINIQTTKASNESSNKASVGPKKIVETINNKPRNVSTESSDSESNDDNEAEEEEEEIRVNKGVARSVDETAEEKRARKAKIKEEKREKRVEKKNKKASK